MEKKPNDNYAGGQWYNLPNMPSKQTEINIVNKYLDLELNNKFIFLHGAGFVLSRNIIKQYLNEIKKKPEILIEISKLHDDVPPLSPNKVKKILQNELKGKLEDFFSEIDLENPIGSGRLFNINIYLLDNIIVNIY